MVEDSPAAPTLALASALPAHDVSAGKVRYLALAPAQGSLVPESSADRCWVTWYLSSCRLYPPLLLGAVFEQSPAEFASGGAR